MKLLINTVSLTDNTIVWSQISYRPNCYFKSHIQYLAIGLIKKQSPLKSIFEDREYQNSYENTLSSNYHIKTILNFKFQNDIST